jgi:outer membrane protein assembly factor BamB
VFALLAVNYLQIRAADPINDPLVTEMRMQFAEAEQEDLAFAAKIRELDLLQRKAFFTSQNILRVGGILLLVGVSVFLVAFKNMTRWRRVTPELSETPAAEKEFLAYATSRQYVMWGGVALLGMGMVASLMTESLLSQTEAGVESDAALVADAPVAKPAPTWEEIQMNWPSFRGPGSTGVARFTNAPTEWDGAAGTTIKWKSPVALQGTNSPVVWGNRLFLSGASDESLEVYCIDTESGELLWTKAKAVIADEMPTVDGQTGFAAPSMVAHGGQVFVIFANGDVASYDFEGNEVWAKSLGTPDNHYGHSSSLIAHEDLVYVQFDQTDKAKLYAFDTATGDERWVKNRESISWASPILADTPDGLQLILNSTNMVDAYDPVSGKKLWAVDCLGGEVGPSPAYNNGVIFVANEYAMASAITVNGSADSMDREVIWDFDGYLPESSSPVGDGERFYFATSYGELVCLNAAPPAEGESVEELWVAEIANRFVSSPILVGDKIYILDDEGTMYIVRAGSEYELIGTSSIGEPTMATPAFMDGRIYIRGEDNLYCIES